MANPKPKPNPNPNPSPNPKVFRKKRHWKELRLPWVSGGLVNLAVNHLPIGFDETIVFAPLALFGHLKTGGAASMLRRTPWRCPSS